MTMIWPFNRERPVEETPVSPETKAVVNRTEELACRVEALGRETRAVAREATMVRNANHFGPALIAAFSAPRRKL